MATMADVARRAKVSPMTVSRVVNNPESVSTATRERVLTAMRDLTYVPNSIARSLISGRTHTLGLIIADLTNPFFTTLARGAEDAAHDHLCRLVLCNHDDDQDKERDYIEALISARVDGMVITPANDGSERNLEFLLNHHIPFILADRLVKNIEADNVVGDSFWGAYELTKRLLDRGHTAIGVITGPLTIHTARERLRGYEFALKERGLSLNPEHTLTIPYSLTPNRSSGGDHVYEVIASMLEQHPAPTAVFAMNNALAIQLLKTLKRMGRRYPDDLDIVCFEDVDPYGLLYPTLTTAVQPAYELGATAVNLLFERIENPSLPLRSVVLRPTIRA